jgi:hypothetical protein
MEALNPVVCWNRGLKQQGVLDIVDDANHEPDFAILGKCRDITSKIMHRERGRKWERSY